MLKTSPNKTQNICEFYCSSKTEKKLFANCDYLKVEKNVLNPVYYNSILLQTEDVKMIKHLHETIKVQNIIQVSDK